MSFSHEKLKNHVFFSHEKVKNYMSFDMKKLRIMSFLRATMSKSLRSLTKNEQMSETIVFLSESLIRSFAHFWAKNERFAQKTDEQIPSPASSHK